MKNQYFADRHDFYKYDLSFELMRSVGGLERFVFGAMLTPDDSGSDGAFTKYPCGTRDPELHRFLQDCLQRGQRDVRRLGDYCATKRFPWAYEPVLEPVLAQEEDLELYFDGLLRRDLDRALVLLDPDNGLIVKSATPSTRCKFVGYDHVARLYEACGPTSVILIFQHFAHRAWPAYRVELGQELRERSGVEHLSCIAPDGLVAYFVATKSAQREAEVHRALLGYGGRNGCKFVVKV